MKKSLLIVLILLALLLGVLTGVLLGRDFFAGDPAKSSAQEEKKILYWVAPMDPNFRRDGPGKSPMGMDLIPVYAGGNQAKQASTAAGTVTISPQVENNLGVRTAPAEKSALSTPIETVGLVQLDEDKLHHVHTRLSGWVHKSWVKAVGDRVAKGQPLLEIYSPELVKAQSELVAALESGNRTLIEATRQRLKSLGIPAAHVRQVSDTRQVSQTITLYAHTDGYVNVLGARDGMYITPATTLMGIGPLDTVWVEGELFPQQGALVTVGDTVTIRGDVAPGRTWTGKLVDVLPDLDTKTRTLRVRVLVNNPDKVLRPGMFVRLRLPGPRVDALTVPRSALIRTGEMDRLVIAEGEGRYRSVRVTAGRELGERVEILAGIKPGTRVVTSAQFLLDSESSISADLERLDGETSGETNGETGSDSPSQNPGAPWVLARVLSMPDDNHYARLQHDPVAEWDWPAMTMGFYVAEAAADGLRQSLQAGARVQVQLRQRDDGKYEVIAMRALTGAAPQDSHQLHLQETDK